MGPAFGEFGPTDNYALLNPVGKWLLTFCMLLGRLEIFTIMVLFQDLLGSRMNFVLQEVKNYLGIITVNRPDAPML